MRFDRSSMALLVLLLGGCAAPAPNPVADLPSSPAVHVAQPVAASRDSSPSPRGPSVAGASDPIASVPAPPLAAPLAEGSDGADGQWEFVLSGSGSSDKKFEAGGFSANASLGYYLGDHFELAVRQSVLFADSDAGGSSTVASTLGALDVVFGSGSFRPLLGVSAGRLYGNAVSETWVGGPEGGFKMYVKKDVFLQLLAQYQFFFRNGDEIDDQFDDGSFVYSLGFGVNF